VLAKSKPAFMAEEALGVFPGTEGVSAAPSEVILGVVPSELILGARTTIEGSFFSFLDSARPFVVLPGETGALGGPPTRPACGWSTSDTALLIPCRIVSPSPLMSRALMSDVAKLAGSGLEATFASAGGADLPGEAPLEELPGTWFMRFKTSICCRCRSTSSFRRWFSAQSASTSCALRRPAS